MAQTGVAGGPGASKAQMVSYETCAHVPVKRRMLKKDRLGPRIIFHRLSPTYPFPLSLSNSERIGEIL